MKKLILFILSFLLLIPFAFAENKALTKKDLEDAFKKIHEYYDYNEFIVNDETIEITFNKDTEDELTYIVSYDLSDKPTFTYDMSFNKGMNYDKYKSINDTYSSVFLYCYSAVGIAYGVDFESILIYMIGEHSNWYYSMDFQNKYVVTYDGYEPTLEDGQIEIKESEFGNYAIDYAKESFNCLENFIDELETFNISFDQITDEDKHLVTVNLTVDNTKDFSPIKGLYHQREVEWFGKDLTEDNADYVVNLKVGQKMKLVYDQSIYIERLSSGGNLEYPAIDSEVQLYTASSVGVDKIRLSSADGTNAKYIYVIISDNPSGEVLDDYILEIDKKPEKDVPPIIPPENLPENPEVEPPKDKTSEDSKEQPNPNTGNQIPALCVISLALGGYVLINYTKRKALFRK